jgi:hypothetical protein
MCSCTTGHVRPGGRRQVARRRSPTIGNSYISAVMVQIGETISQSNGDFAVTMRARLVLDDCEAAFADLQSASQDNLRRRWVTTMTLLRAVGHVLDKVDGEASPALRAAVDRQYRGLKDTWPEPAIFWGFIEPERNSVLKLYEFAVRGNLTIGIPASSTGIAVSPRGTVHASESRFDVWPLTAGRFAGEQPFAVVRPSSSGGAI